MVAEMMLMVAAECPPKEFSSNDPLAKEELLMPEDVELGAMLELFEGIPSDETLQGAVEVRSEHGNKVAVTAAALRRVVEDPSEAERRLVAGQSLLLRTTLSHCHFIHTRG